MDLKDEIIKKQIIELLDNPGMKYRNYKLADIKSKIFVGNQKNIGYLNDDYLKNLLCELEQEGQIYINNRSKNNSMWSYRKLPTDLGYVYGIIKVNKYGEGFVTDGKHKCKIKEEFLNEALSGDIVILRPKKISTNGNYTSYYVDKILRRANGKVICEVKSDDKGNYYLEPIRSTLKHKIIIKEAVMERLVVGDRIQVQINDNKNGVHYADFIELSSHKDDPDRDTKDIALEHNIDIEFSQLALEEAKKLPVKVTEEEMQGRLDCRKDIVFSIDGEDTKDRDDALSVKKLSNGHYMVFIHIADVSHYIHPGMALWNEALNRSTSVYMSQSVIAMLPHSISNGICSLNPGEDRLAFSCIVELNPEAEIVNYDFKECVIKSSKAMVYEDVDKVIEGQNNRGNLLEEDTAIPVGYVDFVDSIMCLDKLAQKIEKIKEKRGYINFGTNDIKISYDKDGNPIRFDTLKNSRSRKIIENFMLLAGECAANYLAVPTVYRVHEKPKSEKVAEVFDLLRKNGIDIIDGRKTSTEKRGIKVKTTTNFVNSKVIQEILKQISDMETRDIVANILIRSMNRARYDTENLGHFGLGLSSYVQFTSPIRRGPDLVQHYNIKLQKNGTFDYANIADYEKFISEYAAHATLKEREADLAERDADTLEMIKYMNNHVGEKFTCRITFLNNKNIFVKTIDGIEGVLKLDEVDGDNFIYDETKAYYRGQKSKAKLKIGTKLTLTSKPSRYGDVVFGMTEKDVLSLKLKKVNK